MDLSSVETKELSEELGASLARLYTFLRRAILPKEMSLTQALAMGTLHQLGPQRVTDLAELEGVRQPTCTGLVNTMEEEGWVVRRPGDLDKRAVMVELTAKGGDVLRAMTDARAELLEGYLARLSVSDQRTLAAALPVLKKLTEIGADADAEPNQRRPDVFARIGSKR
jgi:DNA-binding MarR family transcriptional regulator